MVTLNRCMYAQLEQQEFEAPSGFSMPPAKSPQHAAAQRGMKLSCGFEMLYAKSTPAEVQLAEPAIDLPRSRACVAFRVSELLLSECSHSSGSSSSSSSKNKELMICVQAKEEAASSGAAQEVDERAVSGTPAWQSYKADLEHKGYFQVRLSLCLSARHNLVRCVSPFWTQSLAG